MRARGEEVMKCQNFADLINGDPLEWRPPPQCNGNYRVSGPLGLLRLFFEGAVVKTAGGIYVLRGESAK